MKAPNQVNWPYVEKALMNNPSLFDEYTFDSWYESMPKEVKKNKAMRTIYNEETLTLLKQWSMPNQVKALCGGLLNNLLLFDEHTFGLAMSHGHQGMILRLIGQQVCMILLKPLGMKKRSRVHRSEQYIVLL